MTSREMNMIINAVNDNETSEGLTGDLLDFFNSLMREKEELKKKYPGIPVVFDNVELDWD